MHINLYAVDKRCRSQVYAKIWRVTILDQIIGWFCLLEWDSYIRNRKQKYHSGKPGRSDLAQDLQSTSNELNSFFFSCNTAHISGSCEILPCCSTEIPMQDLGTVNGYSCIVPCSMVPSSFSLQFFSWISFFFLFFSVFLSTKCRIYYKVKEQTVTKH